MGNISKTVVLDQDFVCFDLGCSGVGSTQAAVLEKAEGCGPHFREHVLTKSRGRVGQDADKKQRVEGELEKTQRMKGREVKSITLKSHYSKTLLYILKSLKPRTIQPVSNLACSAD